MNIDIRSSSRIEKKLPPPRLETTNDILEQMDKISRLDVDIEVNTPLNQSRNPIGEVI
jgi:hypothetical protein